LEIKYIQIKISGQHRFVEAEKLHKNFCILSSEKIRIKYGPVVSFCDFSLSFIFLILLTAATINNYRNLILTQSFIIFVFFAKGLDFYLKL